MKTFHFTLIDSTNTWAKQNAHLFERDGITLVVADEQSAGRGRFKRRWVSPPGQNIYASFCLFVNKKCPWIGNIPQVAAISIARVLEELGLCPDLKWPNDVLLSGKKVAGILAETTVPDVLADELCLIIGIGLNVNMPTETLLLIDRPATSLLAETGRIWEVADILDRLQKQLIKDVALVLKEGFSCYFEEYERRIKVAAKGLMQFHDNTLIWKGFLHKINSDGSLSLRLENGEIKTFFTGEVLFLVAKLYPPG